MLAVLLFMPPVPSSAISPKQTPWPIRGELCGHVTGSPPIPAHLAQRDEHDAVPGAAHDLHRAAAHDEHLHAHVTFLAVWSHWLSLPDWYSFKRLKSLDNRSIDLKQGWCIASEKWNFYWQYCSLKVYKKFIFCNNDVAEILIISLYLFVNRRAGNLDLDVVLIL